MAAKNIKKSSSNIAGADESAERSNYDLFRNLGTRVRGFRNLEIKAANGKRSEVNTPKLPPGEYRCYVLESDPVKKEKILLKKTITLSLPILAEDPFKTDADCNLIGYDTEYEEIKPATTDPVDWATETLEVKHPRFKMLSHQLWFNFGGVRFGVVYLTSQRFTQRQFVEMLGAVVPPLEVPKGKNAEKKRLCYVYSYFSLIESGWMLLGKPDMKINKKVFPTKLHEKLCDVRKVNEAHKDPTKRPRAIIKEKGREWEGDSEIHDGVSSLLFADAGNYVRGGLALLGEEIGIAKIKITTEQIGNMSVFRDESFDEFIEYGINDSVIAAEAHNFYKNTTREVVKAVLADVMPDSKLDLDVTKTRITGYSAHVFRAIYKELFGINWKQLLGYEKVGRRVVQTIMHKAFTKYYYGGRNDVLEVSSNGPASYFDLHSAYPTAVAMMGDFDFSRHIHWSAEGAKGRVEKLIEEDNPFLPFGVTVSFIFHKEITDADGVVRIVRPIFPCRIDDSESMPGVKNAGGCDGLVFPRTGVTNVTWPEYWVAVKSGLLKEHMILEFIEFEPVTEENGSGVQTFKLSRVMKKLLEVRAAGSGATKSYIKALTNYFYGLSAASVADASKVIKTHDEGIKQKASGVSSYPLASYITGLTRAVVGELLQRNHCYAITTDGFITKQDSLTLGELCLRVKGNLYLKDDKGKEKLFINLEKSGNRSIFTKTRGYMLLQDDAPTKIAAQGAQVRDDGEITEKSAVSLLEQLQRGWADKTYWPELSEVRKNQAKDPDFVPYKMCRKDAKIDMTFDFKHKPVIDTEKKDEHWVTFNYKGKDYQLMSFKTVPLETVHDFHVIRTLSKRRDYMREYSTDLNKSCKELNDQFGHPGMFKKEKDLECIVDAKQEAKMHKPWMDWDDYVSLMAEYAKYEEGRQYEPEPAEFTGDEDFDGEEG